MGGPNFVMDTPPIASQEYPSFEDSSREWLTTESLFSSNGDTSTSSSTTVESTLDQLQQSLSPPVANQYQEVKGKIESLAGDLNNLDSLLTREVRQNIDGFIQKLAISLNELHKLAVFIRGDYDNRHAEEVLDKGLKSILTECTQTFSECSAEATAGFNRVQDISEQITASPNGGTKRLREGIAIAETELSQHRAQLEEESQASEAKLWGLRQEYTQTETELRDARRKEHQAMANAEYYMTSQGAATASAFGRLADERRATWLTIGEAIRREEYAQREARRQTEHLRQDLARLEQSVGLLKTGTDALDARGRRLVEQFAQLRDQAETRTLLVEETEGWAETTMSLDHEKSIIASKVLVVCRSSMIDSRVHGEVDRIKREIVSGYDDDRGMPEEVQELLAGFEI